MAEPTWIFATAGTCDLQCDHISCRAFNATQGLCCLCRDTLDAEFFAHRSDGTGASHPGCRLEQMGRHPQLPDLVVENGEFHVRVPATEQEAESLRWLAEAAQRFQTAVQAAVRKYEGDRIVPPGRRRKA